MTISGAAAVNDVAPFPKAVLVLAREVWNVFCSIKMSSDEVL